MATRAEILALCNQWLQPQLFQDYAPNGLQVEGKETVNKIVAAVTASRAAIEFAAANGADMLLVHHGMFWKNEPVPIVGWKKERIAKLLGNEINLVAYHLPLDAHSEWGNNAQLAKQLGWLPEKQCGEMNLLNIGKPETGMDLGRLSEKLQQVLGRQPTVIGDMGKPIRKIAWCTGGAQSFFAQAIAEQVDVYVTGEISEAQFHLANETGTAFIGAGHHATERYGVQALAAVLQQKLCVEITFFDEKNPA